MLSFARVGDRCALAMNEPVQGRHRRALRILARLLHCQVRAAQTPSKQRDRLGRSSWTCTPGLDLFAARHVGATTPVAGFAIAPLEARTRAEAYTLVASDGAAEVLLPAGQVT